MHHRFAQVQMVTLYVGKDKIEFHLHEDQLCGASPVFHKAFTSDFQEGSKRTMDLPDDDAGLFDHLVTCIYSKSFDMDLFGDATSDSEKEVQAAQLFALAEKYDVGTVMLNIGIGIYAHAKANRYVYIAYQHKITPPDRRAVEIAYEYTSRDSMLRKVFIDWYSVCDVCEDTDLRDWLPTVPEFASDLVVTKSRQMQYFMREEEDYISRLTDKQHKVLRSYKLHSC